MQTSFPSSLAHAVMSSITLASFPTHAAWERGYLVRTCNLHANKLSLQLSTCSNVFNNHSLVPNPRGLGTRLPTVWTCNLHANKLSLQLSTCSNVFNNPGNHIFPASRSDWQRIMESPMNTSEYMGSPISCQTHQNT